jgi:YVTN family beta-propeller protein
LRFAPTLCILKKLTKPGRRWASTRMSSKETASVREHPGISAPAPAQSYPSSSAGSLSRNWSTSSSVCLCVGAVLCCGALLTVAAAAQQIEPPRTALINPRAIAINPATHRVYAVDQPDNSVITEDILTGVSTAIPVGKTPDALAVDAELNRIYVVNSASDTVSVIDGARQSVVATVSAGRMPYAIGIDPGLHRVLVMNTYSSFATEIDEASDRASSLPLGSKDAVVIDSTLHLAWLLGYEDRALAVLDETSGTTQSVPAVMHLWGLAVDEQRGKLYATEAQSRALLALQEKTLTETTIPVGAMPCAVAVDPRTGLVYVLNYAGDSVTVVQSPPGKALATIPVGSRPEAIAIDPERELIYVANTHGNSVSVIEGHAHAVVATLPAGRNPYAISIDSKLNAVYVANFGSPAYTRLKTGSLRP